MKKRQETKKFISILILGIVLITVYKTLDSFGTIFAWLGKLKDIIMPFFMALLLAYMLYIPCRGVEKAIRDSKVKFLKKRVRGISVFIVYLMVLIALFIIFTIIVPRLQVTIIEIVNNFPDYYNKSIEFIKDLPEESFLRKLNLDVLVTSLEQKNIGERIIDLVDFENLQEYIKGVVGITHVLFDIFVVIVVSIYILLERGKIKEFLKSLADALFSDELNQKLDRYYNETNRVFFGFVAAQLTDSVFVGVLISIAMIIMKVKYAVLLGFMIGLFNIIPYLGAIVAVTIAGLITIFTGGFSQALTMLIVVIIIQQIDANIIEPKIIGSSLKLSPILIIFSVTLLGAYFGILGMFLAVPIVAMIKVLVLDFIKERKQEKLLLKQSKDK